MIDKIIKDVREGVVKELLYANADKLILRGDSWDEVGKSYTRWKRAMTEKGLKVNVKKMKVFFYWREN